MAELAAEKSRFKRLEVYGDAVVRPGAAGEIDLCTATIPAGQWAWISLLQAVTLNPTTTLLNRIVTGVQWRLYAGDLKGASTKPVNLGAVDPIQRWTFTDGTPCARNILVSPAQTLVFRVVWDPATSPVAITHVAGAIVGVSFDAEALSEFDALAFLDTP